MMPRLRPSSNEPHVVVAASLCLSREIAGIERLNGLLREVFARAGTVRSVSDDLKLCLNEAVANVMTHGRTALSATLRIDVHLIAAETRATAYIDDNCVHFDPLRHPLRAPMNGLRRARIGGFGIALIRATASDLRWQALGDNGNRLSIVCELPSPG